MRTFFTLAAAAIMIGLSGCQLQQPRQEYSSSSVLDVRPVRTSTPRFTPPAVVATPPEEPALATVTGPSDRFSPDRTAAVPGRPARWSAHKSAANAQQVSYKVKKGDTLYRIAKTEYGDGKKWTVIASANPGVSPQSLKAGQTILIP